MSTTASVERRSARGAAAFPRVAAQQQPVERRHRDVRRLCGRRRGLCTGAVRRDRPRPADSGPARFAQHHLTRAWLRVDAGEVTVVHHDNRPARPIPSPHRLCGLFRMTDQEVGRSREREAAKKIHTGPRFVRHDVVNGPHALDAKLSRQPQEREQADDPLEGAGAAAVGRQIVSGQWICIASTAGACSRSQWSLTFSGSATVTPAGSSA